MSETPARRIALLLLSASLAVAADEVAVMPLRHRTVDQVLPVLQPLLDPGGALSGMGDTLIVRSSPENIAQLRQVLAAIDTAPRTLTISVRQVSGDRATRRGDGSEAQRRERDEVLQRVRTLDGTPAYLAIGQSVPIPSGHAAVHPGGGIQSTVTIRDYATGFTVVPHVSGDHVRLEIGAAQDRALGGHGGGRTQGLAATVSGRLGEWLAIGTLEQASVAGRDAMGSGVLAERNRSANIEVRVDEVP